MNKNLEILYIDEIDREKWNGYVKNHSRGNIFQTTYYLSLFEKRFKSSYFGFAIVDDGEIKGVLGGTILYNYVFPLSILTRRAIIEGGPLVDDDNPELCQLLLQTLQKYVKRKAIYVQFRNMWDTDGFKKVFVEEDYQYEEHLDIIHSLDKGVDDVIAKINKKKRAKVRNAQNKGTLFSEIVPSEIVDAVNLVLSTYKRIGVPSPDKDFLIHSYIQLTKERLIKVFVAKVDGCVIGVRMELCFNGVIYDWYVGSDDKYKNYSPNDFLPYNILLWGVEHNYKTFDFGGAGKPNVPYGVRDHKIKFGGTLVEYGRYMYVANRFLYSIGKVGFNLMKHGIRH